MRVSVTSFLPHLKGVHVDDVTVDLEKRRITLIMHTVQPTARCPLCRRRSKKVHSSYRRTVADLPWSGLVVSLQVQARRFVCAVKTCIRKIFCERLPHLVAVYARRTHHLRAALVRLGLDLGGKAGARLATRQGMGTSRMTLLRLVRTVPLAPAPTPRVLGVDDWSWRRGRRYGSVLVDLERHCRVDLLPDRSAETFATWLRAHPGVEVISRDRAGTYAEGARQGAPHAVQVADRWHLLHNMREVVERVLTREHASVRAATHILVPPAAGPSEVLSDLAPPVPADTVSPADAAAPPSPSRLTRRVQDQQARRDQRYARYEEIIALHHQGLGQRDIARRLKVGRKTVRRFVQAGTFPERRLRAPRRTILAPFESYLRERWNAGCQNAQVLWTELRAHGFVGSPSTVRHHLARWRPAPGRSGPSPQHGRRPYAPAPPAVRTFSVRQATWLLLRAPDDLDDEEQAYLVELLRLCPAAAMTYQLAQGFGTLVRERQSGALEMWIRDAEGSAVPELRGFAAGVRKDRAAVDAALTLEWSNGQTEGHVNKLKTLKRAMFGRAGFDLLRHRLLDAG